MSSTYNMNVNDANKIKKKIIIIINIYIIFIIF